MVRRAPSGTPATVALTAAGVAFTQHAYEHDPAAPSYGLEAAHVLGLPAEQVFKTLLVDTGAGLAVGVVPVAGQLDLKAMAGALGVKRVTMADPAAAERSTGYVVGGISPVGRSAPCRRSSTSPRSCSRSSTSPVGAVGSTSVSRRPTSSGSPARPSPTSGASRGAAGGRARASAPPAVP